MSTRKEMWEKLGTNVDVLVVGGGITGCGVARDAVRRGLSVALVEMQDLAFGTSSRSSKLVHGGLRYLEHYEFGMVFESLSERRILLDLAPHLVNPLGFLFPVYKDARQSLFMINAGMWLYDGLSLFRSPKRHKTLKPKEVGEEEPCLTRENLKGAPLYYDCATDDARLTLETALDAAECGATIATWAKVKGFLKTPEGRVQGAMVKNLLTGEIKEVKAKVVINATGPWTDATMSMSAPQKQGVLRPTKGVHIVVDRKKLPINNAVVCFHPTDERVLFAIPWGDRTYIGTTDTDYKGNPGEVAADSNDVSYLIDAAAAYFPEHPIDRGDVLSTWAGLRPLIAPPIDENGEVSTAQVSREHEILVGNDGLITIAGGKLTTYRKMSAEVVDRAVDLLRLMGTLPKDLKEAKTDRHPLPGGVGWPEDDDHAAVASTIQEASGGVLTEATSRLLADTYGMRGVPVASLCKENNELAEAIVPHRPEILAQVVWAAREELCATVSDVMIRRTQLYFREENQGLDAVDKVAALLASELGWSDDEKANHIAMYQKDVARSRQWQSE